MVLDAQWIDNLDPNVYFLQYTNMIVICYPNLIDSLTV